jgi:tRNA (cytidine/uridine-2'-O-)-methyltransferase
MDYWNHLDWEVVDDWAALVDRLGGRPRWLLSKTAQRPYTDAQFEPEAVLVFGCESAGLPASLLKAEPERCLRIPIAPEARSLNLSVAAAVVAFEARRQLSAD